MSACACSFVVRWRGTRGSTYLVIRDGWGRITTRACSERNVGSLGHTLDMRVASHTSQRAFLGTAIVAVLPAWEDEVRELALGEIARVGMELVAPVVWQ